MAQDGERNEATHQERVLHVTAAELRDRPVASGEPLGSGQATDRAAGWQGATQSFAESSARFGDTLPYAAEDEGWAWGRRGLMAAGLLAPLGLLAIPGVRQALTEGWRTGSEQAAEGWRSGTRRARKTARRGAREVSDTVESGKRNVAETVESGRESLLQGWRSGKREVAEKVEDFREAREARQRRERELEAERWERWAAAVDRLQHDVERWSGRRQGRSTLKPFLFGTLVSGGLALLFAPRAGEQLRAQLRQTSRRWQGQAAELAGQAREQAGAVQAQAQGLASQVKAQARQVTEQVKEQARPLAGQTQGPAAAPATGLPPRSGAALSHAASIKEHMAIVGAHGEPVGTVDHLDVGDTIKVTKDAEGKHHWIPLKWVARVDDRVHLDRAGQQAQREWGSTPPQGGR